ncbi:MAG: hypothetical protein KA151_10650 [Piscinibacter sp.]|nr:hypothetical protein [Piscinibacter sp.]
MKIPAAASRVAACAAAALCLAGCGGGEIGGTVSGLGSERSVTLDNNGSDTLTVTTNGSFVFANTVAANKAYEVTVLTQPVGQICTVTSGTGTVNADGDPVDSVRVACTDVQTLTGTLAGLVEGTGVTLINGTTTQLVLNDNGPFAFAGVVEDGAAYDVTVLRQPFVGFCTVTNGKGVFDADVPTAIVVTCS